MSDQAIDQAANVVLNGVGEKIEVTPEQKAAEEANAREVLAAAAPLEPDPEPEEPQYEPSKGAALLQDLIQRIDLRATERTELVAELCKMEFAAERMDREEKKELERMLEENHREYVSRKARLENNFQEMVDGRKESIAERKAEIAALDKSLDQMRKQVNAEVAKLAPERKVAS